MKRDSAPSMVMFATVGMGILGGIAFCVFLLGFVVPRLRGTSALPPPADSNLSFAEYNKRGNDLYEQHLFKRAAAAYGHMIEKKPDAWDGYLLRGMAEEKQGDYRQAVRDNTEGLKHASNDEVREDFFFNRGLAYRYLGDYKASVADFNQVIALHPNNGNAYDIRAFCYTALGDYDRAIADYNIGIAHDPHPGTIFERGQAYLKKKDYQKALADLNRSIALQANFAPAYPLRAEAYIGLKEYDRAVADAEQAARLENSAANRGSLGWYQYLAGKLPEAITNEQMAVKMDPNLTFARFNLGLCYAVQGNADAAQTAYQDALSHAKPADLQGALQDVKDALKKQPNTPALNQAETLLQNARSHPSATS